MFKSKSYPENKTDGEVSYQYLFSLFTIEEPSTKGWAIPETNRNPIEGVVKKRIRNLYSIRYSLVRITAQPVLEFDEELIFEFDDENEKNNEFTNVS